MLSLGSLDISNNNLALIKNKNDTLKKYESIDVSTILENIATIDPYTIYRCGDYKKFGAELKLLNTETVPRGRKRRLKKEFQLDWNKLLHKPLRDINKNNKSVIYRIFNKKELNINGEFKFYIGKTKGTVGARMNAHFRAALRGRGCPRLAEAIRKFGINAFRVEILYQGPHINSIEHQLIKTHHATDPNLGYNIAN